MASYLEIAGLSGRFGGVVSVADSEYASLVALGYSGTLTDMEMKDFRTKLSLVEPPFKSHADMEYQYLGTLGKTGSLADRKNS